MPRLVPFALLLCAFAPSSAAPAVVAWSAPVNLSAVGQSAFRPQVAVDPNGNAVAVWLRYNGSNNIVQAAIRPKRQSWGAPVNLSAAGQDAFYPQVALDPNGNAVAVWYRSNGSNKIVQAAIRPVGLAWSGPANLSAAGQNATSPQVAFDTTGNAFAVWVRSNGLNTIVQAVSRPKGGVWGFPSDLSAAGQSARDPEVALDSNGNEVGVWLRYNGSNYIVQAAIRPNGGPWYPAIDLSAAGGSVFDPPQVALDPNGNAVAVWSRYSGSQTIVQVASRPKGGHWSPHVDLSAGQRAISPHVALDAAGNAIAVWQSASVQAASRPSGGVWSVPVDLSAAGQSTFYPKLALGRDGSAVVVWQRTNGSSSIVVAAVRPKRRLWGKPVDLSAAGQSGAEPQVALDATGNAIAVWGRSNGSNFIVQASAFASAFAP